MISEKQAKFPTLLYLNGKNYDPISAVNVDKKWYIGSRDGIY